MKKKLKLGSKLVVSGINSVVSYVNAGIAYVSPVEDGGYMKGSSTRRYLQSCVFAKIDTKASKVTLKLIKLL